MSTELLVNVTPSETRVALVEHGILQEVHIERQAKRGLALLEGDIPLAAGAELRRDDQLLGSVVASAGTLSLAVLPLDHDGRLQGPGGTPLREQALQAGLAR